MMPLTMCKAGEENEIKKIGGKKKQDAILRILVLLSGEKWL